MENLRETIKRAQEGNEDAKEALKFLENFAAEVDKATKQAL